MCVCVCVCVYIYIYIYIQNLVPLNLLYYFVCVLHITYKAFNFMTGDHEAYPFQKNQVLAYIYFLSTIANSMLSTLQTYG